MIKEGLTRNPGGSGASRWRRCAVAAAAALAALIVTAASQASSLDRGAAARAALSTRIAGQYIVVLKGGLPKEPTRRSERHAREEDARVAASVNAKPRFEYNADLRGFAAHLTHKQLRELRQSGKVAFIEQDARVKELDTQTGAPWNLTRIDERTLYLNGVYNYSPTAGAGVHAYIIDTGILASNVDFGSRASNGFDAFPNQKGSGTDCNGHGTHVAGTVGGTRYGVAKRATLIGVRVLNCYGSGTMSGVIAGVNWVTEHHVADKSVANMSLGGGATPALDDAVNHLVESGVFVAVAAGNNNRNACDYSPARASDAFTTAASDNTDRKATFSNWGTCVDGWAPGVSVTSDWIGSNTATNTISGTSMASPNVAGVAALYLSEHASTPAATTTWIRENATPDLILNGGYSGSPNLLLYKADL